MSDVNAYTFGPDAKHWQDYKAKYDVQKYLEDLDYFLAIIEENIDFKIKDVLNRRQIKRKNGISHESEQEKAALAMYKVACKLAKDWESFWCRRDYEEKRSYKYFCFKHGDAKTYTRS